MQPPTLRVTVAVEDRIMLHLWEQDHQADHYMVSGAVTRPGIAENCALHPPNVSRAMRSLLRKGWVSEHTRTIRGEDRRQKTWQLTDAGREEVARRVADLHETPVLVRDRDGTLLEVPAKEAPHRLEASLSLLQVLMHAQHEQVLTFGDIRFGPIHKRGDERVPPPGRLTLLAGAHATYHIAPPATRPVHGREVERAALDAWLEVRQPALVVTGIAGIGKSTLVADWLHTALEGREDTSLVWYPCQPWDTAMGIATSLLHRLGIDDDHDPYQLIDTLPLQPGAGFQLDSMRRRLLAYLTDAEAVRDRYTHEDQEQAPKRADDEWLEQGGGEAPASSPVRPPPYWFIVLDDIHHLGGTADELLGTLYDLAQKGPVSLILISRTQLGFYDRRDVHVRDRVREIELGGLTVDDLDAWLKDFDAPDPPAAADVHERTGGHPLAMELLEMYGQMTHGDWLRFLDDEILEVLPDDDRDLLGTLAVSERPVPWETLAAACDRDGPPPRDLLLHGLIVEFEDGLYLHDALRERLLRDVGTVQHERRLRLAHARGEEPPELDDEDENDAS